VTGPILFCGDPHGQFRHIVRAANELQAPAVVLLGDLQAERPLHEGLEAIAGRVWFIHGNHDTDTDRHWANLWESRLADRNIDGRVVELPGGTRLAGLGGVFRKSVWYPGLPGESCFRSQEEHARLTPRQDRWRGGRHRRHWSSIYPDGLDRLSGLRAGILVTHEAPGYHRNGFGVLDTLARSLGAKVAVHGHQHDRLDSSDRWALQGFKSFGVGLRGITAIDADGHARVVVAGELDERRNFGQRYIEMRKDLR